MASKRHKRSWFGCPKKRNTELTVGLKGFICTCNNSEKQCIRESYNLLNEYADKLYGVQPTITNSADDVDDDLSAEVAALKEKSKNSNSYRFQVVESGVRNRLFIKTTLSEPVELVHFILKQVQENQNRKTRYLLRFTPVEVTCKAFLKEIESAAGVLFDKYFLSEGKTFSILVNRHNNDSITRTEIIDQLAEMIKFRHPENKVDLKQPQLTVIVEVMRSICCLSVLPEYTELHKYNIMELCPATEKQIGDAPSEEQAELKSCTDEQNEEVFSTQEEMEEIPLTEELSGKVEKTNEKAVIEEEK